MKRTLIQNLSVNAIQLIINQLFGLGIFYVLSTGLDKSSFGHINLVLAILMAAFNILSLGVDQLVVKRIAGGTDASALLSIYLLHVLITGIVFYVILFIGYYFFPVNQTYNLLLLIGIGKLMIFFSTPFKQVANGMERFKLLAYMSVSSNIVRCLGLIILALYHQLNLFTIILIFIGGDVIEFLACIILFKNAAKVAVKIRWNRTAYSGLLRESLPQTGIVLITSALARFDWIFIGFMVSAIKLAEYSFAYKVFEIATLPLLAIAPLLIPRFTKLFQQTDFKINNLNLLVRLEMIIAAFIALLLNMCWSPVIDGVTSGKYGLINIRTIFILSLCMPFLYLNNFLWTIYFAQGRLKMILTSFIITFLVNVIFDILLIPFFRNEGAAFAFLLSCVVQTIYYLKQNSFRELTHLWQPLVFCTVCALIAGSAAKMLFSNIGLVITTSVLLYVLLLFFSGQIKLSDRHRLAQLFR